MVNPYRGEVEVLIANAAYTLRPTFHILCEIEEVLGMSLPKIYQRLHSKGLLASEILAILTCATQHENSAAFEPETVLSLPTKEVKLENITPEIELFLRRAMGLKQPQESLSATANEHLNWPEMLQLAVRVYGVSVQDFWMMTMPEYLSLLASYTLREQSEPNLGASVHDALDPTFFHVG